METKFQEQLVKLLDSIFAYLPNLLGGIILILLGWLAGWIIKRVIVQFLIILRIDRFLRQARLGADFSKADVRYSVSNFIGNVGFFIIFFIFIDNALLAWKLDILSEMLGKGILFLPKIILAFIIFGVGWLMASWVRISILESLHREKISRASLISKFIRSIVLLFFTAIAFVELGIAREIVIIGFSTIFITLCIIAIVIITIGGKDFLMKIEESFKESS
jgi:hypothetical protein